MTNARRIEISDDSDRFSRFKLINWWDQKRLTQAKIVVIGAGALGNEIIKNLALLGFGQVLIVDMDTIENSNLSRSVLFRENDNGQKKAEIAAKNARDIYPEMKTHGLCLNVIHELGLGIYRWADLVIAGLDNREARLTINRCCWRVSIPWIDGAIEGLNGLARVFFPPNGACYECTLTAKELQSLKLKRSCNLLTRKDMLGGKVPTTPTSASVIAGIQCQEAVKIIHGLQTLDSRGFIFDGLHHNSYTVVYDRKEDCYSHDSYPEIATMKWSVDTTLLGDVLETAKHQLGNDAIVEFSNDVVESFHCPNCNRDDRLMRFISTLNEDDGRCPRCGTMRILSIVHSIDGSEGLNDMTLRNLGMPPFDIISARNGMYENFFEFSDDAKLVLGPLALN